MSESSESVDAPSPLLDANTIVISYPPSGFVVSAHTWDGDRPAQDGRSVVPGWLQREQLNEPQLHIVRAVAEISDGLRPTNGSPTALVTNGGRPDC